MEDAIVRGTSAHQQVQASRSTPQHKADVGSGENHTLGLTRCAGRVNDGDRIFAAHLRTVQRNSVNSREDVVE